MSKYGLEKHKQKMAHLYQTPMRDARELAEKMPLQGRIWEPFAGGGRICKAFKEKGNHVVAFDVRNYGYPLDRCADFFTLTDDDLPEFDHLVSNPPYGPKNSLIEPIVKRALQFRRPGGVVVLLLPADFDHGSTRSAIFADNPEYRGQIKVRHRMVWIDGSMGNGTENHTWHIWGDKGWTWAGRDLPQIDYIGGRDA